MTDTPTTKQPDPRRSELLAGARAELPIVIGGIPFGMIYGVLALAAGLPMILAQGMSAIVFAGSAQFIATDLFATYTPALIILLTTLMVNLRHLLYSASLAPHVARLPLKWRAGLAYFLTDEVYAVTIHHYTQNKEPTAPKHWFFLGAGITEWLFWQTSTAVGIFLGARIPASWSLDFTLALVFIGIVVPTLRDRPHTAAAISAGLVALLAHDLPYQLGLMAAAFTGIAVGMILERR
ncbi:MAG: AzlC family ABC transporter permease [Chloroflexota bacterium]